MMRLVFLTLITLVSISFFSVRANDNSHVTLLVNVPSNTPKGASLSLGGDFNGWNPEANGYELVKMADGRYKYEFHNIAIGKVLNFKVTRGNWDTVEIAVSGANRDNRSLLIRKAQQTFEISVADWADLSTKQAPSTIVGNVVVEDIVLPTYAGKRKLRIYLPPDYASSKKRYPVIYMTDGQNLYDSKTANAGEWQMDELMQKLAEQGSPLTSIVVGIDHAGADRMMEYLPFNHEGSYRVDRISGSTQGQGQVFADWLVTRLKPDIDQRYRTKPEREFTSIMGSSMGGLISCYTALRHQAVISKAACLSSAFLKKLVKEHLITFIANTNKTHPMKIHMDIGDNEFGLFGEQILDENQEVYNTLRQAGFQAEELRYQVIKGGTHDEPSWRSRMEDILLWLNASGSD